MVIIYGSLVVLSSLVVAYLIGRGVGIELQKKEQEERVRAIKEEKEWWESLSRQEKENDDGNV